jgi:hypothetical protein
MDETMIAGVDPHAKVITTHCQKAFREKLAPGPHATMALCATIDGIGPPPSFILPNRTKKNEILNGDEQIWHGRNALQ